MAFLDESARQLHSSPRSRVWRVDLDGRPAIVKQVVDGADPAGRYARELRALRLAARADPPVAPAILDTDEDQLILVLEYVERHRPGPDWVTGYAATLARLHSTTGPRDAGTLPVWAGPTAADVDSFLGLGAALGLPDGGVVRAELSGVLERLDGSAQHALLHGDPCPGNDLHTADGVRFVDFEQASLGNGLVELAYPRIAFPTCWTATALPEHALADAEAAYRTEWRARTGRDVPGDLADACLGWLIRGDALVQLAHRGAEDYLAKVVREDWDWGPPTARERLVHRLGVVAKLAEGNAELRAVGAYCAELRQRMLDRWPKLGPLPSERDNRIDVDS